MKPLSHVLITCLLILILLGSCFRTTTAYNVRRGIITIQDEYKNSKKHLLQQTLFSEECTFLSSVSSLTVIYEREFLPFQPDNHNIYLTFSRATTSFTIDEKGFLKIGKTIFPIKAAIKQTRFATEQSTTTDTTGMSITETAHWLNDYFKIPLTTDMIDLLRQKQPLTLRFYAGPIPVTFTVKGNNAEKLIEWANKM